MLPKFNKSSARFLPLLLLSGASPAFAQSEAAAAGDESVQSPPVLGDEIIVTAQKRAQSLQDVSVSVSVVSGDDLAANSIRTLEDVAGRLPSLKIAQTPGTDQIFIRGVGSGLNLGFEQSVATFIDNVYRSRSRASRLAFFDVERIEVLRGPQTTYFGNNAIAGAINITTRKPSNTFDYNVRTLYSPSDGEYAIEGGVSVPLTPTLSLRAAGNASGMDGYIDNTRLDNDGPDTSTRIGRVAAHWEPDPVFTVDARFDVGRVRDDNVFNAELLNCPAEAAFGAPRGACGRFLSAQGEALDDNLDYVTDIGPSSFDFDYREALLTASALLHGHRLVWTTGYYEHDYEYLADVIPGGNNASVVGTLSGLPTRSAEDYRQFSQEVRFESVDNDSVEYMAGLYYSNAKLRVPTASGFYFAPFGAFTGGLLNPGDPIQLDLLNSQRDDLFSLFGSLQVNLSPSLRASVGARYSIVDKEAHRSARIGVGDDTLLDRAFVPAPGAAQAILLPITGTASGDFVNPTRSDKKFMPSVKVEWDVADDVLTYASYTKGFKAGGFAVGSSNATFAPETVDAYEIGLRSQFLNRAVTVNLSAFYSEYQDLQESTFFINAAGTPISTIDNAAKSIVKGVELNGRARVSSELSFNFDVAYLSSKYDSYPLAPCTSFQSTTMPGCTQDLSGKRRAYAPEWSGNIGVTYERDIGSGLSMGAASSVFFTSAFDQDVSRDPLLRQSGYSKIDARVFLGSAFNSWRVAIIGKNLTDKTTASVRRPLPSSPGSVIALPDRPRSFALQFTWEH